jgi:hypothetical protein
MKKINFVIIIAAAFFSFNISAQNADDIINKYVKAIGGYENLKNIKTLRLTGKAQVKGFDLPLIITFKRPSMVRVEVKLEDVSQVQAYDGTMGWKTDFMTGGLEAQKMEKDEEDELKFTADFEGAIIDYKKKGFSIWNAGKQKTDSSEFYKIGVLTNAKDTGYYYIDSKSYLQLERIKKRIDKNITVETVIKGYLTAEKVKFPSSLEVKIEGNDYVQVIKFDKAEVNIDIDDSIFKMPENK